MVDPLQEVADKMDLDRTDEIFDVTIKRTGYKDEKVLLSGDDEIKKAKIVIAAGNLHVKSAQTKATALRFIGYQNSIRATKDAIFRRVRNSRKHGE